MSKIVLQLFIAGRNARAEQAIATLRHIRERDLAAYQVEIEIVDVLADPQQAEERRILATPTLIKLEPAPQRRIVGDLADSVELIAALQLPPDSHIDRRLP